MNTLFYLSIILFAGLIMGRVVKLIHLPNVTGYLLAGLIIGPYCLKILQPDFVTAMDLASEMALAFIAFTIGAEFKISYLKRLGMTPVIIAIFEALTAVFAVFISLYAFGFDLQLALLLGAIASATAPAATIMVVKQYDARGPVTDTLLSVVALDDAVALMAFGFASATVAVMGASADVSVFTMIAKPIVEIVCSIVLGFILGLVFLIPLKYFKKDSNRTIIMTAFVFFGSAIADYFGLSSLLLCMCMGAMLVNVSSSADSIMRLADNITPPIFVMFFVTSGAELDVTILPQLGLIGFLYVVTRVVGKVLGAYIGAVIMKAPPTVKKYIGFTLVPQAGVAIGLSLIAANEIPGYGATIRAVVLCATLIYELTGPVLTKVCLKKAGEIKVQE